MDIFRPLASEIGQSLAEKYRDSKRADLEPPETDNLRRHVEGVRQKSEPPTGEPTRKQRENLFDWIDEASSADPDTSPEEAAKWQAILSEILGSNDAAVIEALRSLNKYDVAAIAQLGVRSGRLKAGEKTRLTQLGIVEPITTLANFSLPSLFLLMAVTLFFVGLSPDTLFFLTEGHPPFDEMDLNNSSASFYSTVLLFYSLVSLLSFFILFYFRLNLVSFTRLGLDVKEKVDLFFRKRG
jgi:hypothetical protein